MRPVHAGERGIEVIITAGQKYHACGKLIRDAEYSTFGSKGYHQTKLVVSAGSKEEPPLYCKALFEEAEVCKDLKKGDVVSIDGVIRSREWQGKQYTDYEVEFISVQGKARAERKDDNWAPVSTEEVPF